MGQGIIFCTLIPIVECLIARWKPTKSNSFQDRIKQATLTMLFKILRGNVPQYIINIMLELNGPRNYILRNNSNLRAYCRLETYKKSFFSRAIRLWNDLTDEMKFKESVGNFRKQFAVERNELQVLYYYGERWPCVHHARIRIGCSKLNNDLFNNLHVVDSPSCICGAPYENAEHFFFHCPRFYNIRQTLLDDIQGIMPINVDHLLYGNADYDTQSNEESLKLSINLLSIHNDLYRY